MPRNKVLERAKVSAPTGRNEYDLSCIRNFTALAGYANLVLAQPVLAGTHGRINRSTFTRTADVVAPAFPKVTQHIDFFIVNLKSLWSYWENFKLNINDLKSTQLVSFDGTSGAPVLTIPDYCPTFDFGLKPHPDHPVIGPRESAAERIFPIMTSTPSLAQLNNISMKRNNALRLFNAIGVGRTIERNEGGTVQTMNNVQNLFKLAAYQKCYFEHYRNTAYESNDPYAYNLDWVSNNGLSQVGAIIDPNTSAGSYTMQQLCTLRKVNYRNDYFHNIYPSLNYVSSQPSGVEFTIPSNIVGALGTASPNAFGVRVAAKQAGVGNVPSMYQTNTNIASNTQYISVQGIRAMFALDKLMRASAYAPKHVKDQWKAQFGVDIPDDSDMVSRRLGSFQNDIIFQEVTQTSPYTSSNLGDLGAKGVGQGQLNQDIDFYAQYDSIVIGIQYFMPRAMYDSFGMDIWNINRARGDFYSKFFENLGLRPIYAKELSTLGFTRTGTLDPNTVIGYTVPNQTLKIGKDLNLGEFQSEFEYYAVNDNQDGVFGGFGHNYLRTFTMHNMATQQVVDNNGNISALYFKVNPEDLDYIFRVPCQADHRLGFFQFYGQLYIKLVISAPMGVHGQPHM